MLGARRVGKTILLEQVIEALEEKYVLLNGEDITTRELLSRKSVQRYKQLLGSAQVLIIDEAQNILDVGTILKLMVDEMKKMKKMKILVTGSSAFDIDNVIGEPPNG